MRENDRLAPPYYYYFRYGFSVWLGGGEKVFDTTVSSHASPTMMKDTYDHETAVLLLFFDEQKTSGKHLRWRKFTCVVHRQLREKY